ncbi:MAG: DUF4115 domain-containing protein [Dehalococcoidia bacterium]
MLVLLLVVVIGLIAVGLVVAVTRDATRHGYPADYRRHGVRTPFEAERSRASRRSRPADEDEAYFDDPPPPVAARRPIPARAAPVAAAARGGTGGRGGLLVAAAVLGAFAALLVLGVTQPWADGESLDPGQERPAAGVATTGEASETAAPGEAGTSTAPATATATAAATRTSTPAPANAATLTVQARQQSSVRVSVDGAIAYEGTLGAGESRSWSGSVRVQLWTNNGKNVAVTVNGFDLGALSTAVGHPEWNTVDWGWAAGWRP